MDAVAQVASRHRVVAAMLWRVEQMSPSTPSGLSRVLARVRRTLTRPPDPAEPEQESSEPGPPAVAPDAGWWELLPFTTHRIRLSGPAEPVLYTAETGVDPSVDVRTRLVEEACGGSLAGRSVVDLGCLEGGFALEFGRRGASRVVGVEARSISVRRCELARALLGLDQVQFVLADVKDELVRHPDGFDVVFAAGILYHLADPAGFLALVRQACRTVALVDTHVAQVDAPSHGCSDHVVSTRFGDHEYRGRLFGEYDQAVTDDERESMLWAAWSDAASFWPFEEDLVRMLHDVGFTEVRQVEREHMVEPWQVDHANRVLYVCVP